MFPNARNTVINGGTFTGIFHSHNIVNDVERLMGLLLPHIAPGAFHNSNERYDPPKCHPRTRRAILKKIKDWVMDADKVALILWLYGPAGAGKSAIAQTIAELLEAAGLLAAAFFFSRNSAACNNKTPLVATLVYQLVISIPEIRAHVLEAVEQDPALFSRSIDAQVQALIVKPLNAVAYLLSRPRLIILDGLDECDPTSAQTSILNALSTAVKHLHRDIRLRFLIASRPEQVIRQSFNNQNGLGSLSFSIALNHTYHSDNDIRVFLESTFDEIKRNHPLKTHLPTSWPSPEDTWKLVEKSSGQFIFASTVAKYLNSPRHRPHDRLKIIFGQSAPGQETPFAELDGLYHLIFSSVADTDKLQDFLMFLVLRPFSRRTGRGSWWRQTTMVIEKFLFYRPGEIDIVLTDLHSIINDTNGEPGFFHASLPDFLLDRSRSRHLFLDQGAAYAKLAALAVKHINNPTKSPLWDLPKCVHGAFQLCCLKAHPSPKFLEDLCGLNLAAHFKRTPCQPPWDYGIADLICWFERQRLGLDGVETLLDRHLATFDVWLQAQLMPLSLSSSPYHYLTVVTLLDRLNPKECTWEMFQVISPQEQHNPLDLFGEAELRTEFSQIMLGGAESRIEFFRIVSKFLMNRERAGSFWVNPQKYADLARRLLEILRDDRFTDIVDIHTMIWQVRKRNLSATEYYDVRKLVFNLLPILLSRIKALGGPQVHEVTILLRTQPTFCLIENDPLVSEKGKVAQAVEEFLKQ